MKKSISPSSKYRKELEVWITEQQIADENLQNTIFNEDDNKFLPPRFSDTKIISTDFIDDTIIHNQESIQKQHSEFSSAQKMKDYYSKWDKYDPKQKEAEKKIEKKIERTPEEEEKFRVNNEKANKEKEAGNDWFKANQFDKAIECYSKAILLNSMEEVYPLNRAMCWLKLKQWDKAIEDCDYALKLNEKSSKAYFRKATAQFNLKQYQEALANCQNSLKIEPKNSQIPPLKSQIENALKASKTAASLITPVAPGEQVKAEKAAPLPTKPEILRETKTTISTPASTPIPAPVSTPAPDTAEKAAPAPSQPLPEAPKKVEEIPNSPMEASAPLPSPSEPPVPVTQSLPPAIAQVSAQSSPPVVTKIPTDTQDILLKSVISKPPSSLIEFEKAIKNLNGFPNYFYSYLKVPLFLFPISFLSHPLFSLSP